jgi:hypothetical protein
MYVKQANGKIMEEKKTLNEVRITEKSQDIKVRALLPTDPGCRTSWYWPGLSSS